MAWIQLEAKLFLDLSDSSDLSDKAISEYNKAICQHPYCVSWQNKAIRSHNKETEREKQAIFIQK